MAKHDVQAVDSGRGTAEEVPSNLHVLPIHRKKTVRKPVRSTSTTKESSKTTETEKPLDFSGLATKLEERIGRIESELKESLDLLEHDIARVVKARKLTANERDVRADLDALANQLEARLQKTMQWLSLRENRSREDKAHLESVKRLSSHLIKMLSFDFYKSVLDRLSTNEFQEEVDPFGMDRYMIAKIKPVFDFMYHRYWRVKTTGIENIPDDGRALIVANHSGTVPYDGAMIKTAILNEHPKRKDARFLVENFVFHMPFLGSFMYRIGGVRACPENAEFLLDSGHLVVVFPEGVKGIGKFYKNRYQLQRFGRGGFIKLCMKTQSPLIPVGIVGAEEIHPIIFKSNTLAKTIGLPYIPITPTFPLLGLLGLIPLPTKWSMHFGKPIRFDSHGPQAIDDDLLIHKLSEKVRGEIQEILYDLLRKRRSIWVK